MESNAANVTKLGALADGKSSYERWAEEQGVPIVKAFFLPNLNEVALAAWERKGGNGAIINLEGTGDTDDAYICEMAPGRKSAPERHVYEELVYVLEGRGATTIWQEGGAKQTFEWQAGSLFVIPLNAWFQHFNGSGHQSARYIAFTSAPLMMNLLNDQEFIFNCPYVFRNRFDGEIGLFQRRRLLFRQTNLGRQLHRQYPRPEAQGKRRARPRQSHYHYRDRLQRADRAHVAVFRRTVQKSASACRGRSNHYSRRRRLFSVVAGGI